MTIEASSRKPSRIDCLRAVWKEGVGVRTAATGLQDRNFPSQHLGPSPTCSPRDPSPSSLLPPFTAPFFSNSRLHLGPQHLDQTGEIEGLCLEKEFFPCPPPQGTRVLLTPEMVVHPLLTAHPLFCALGFPPSLCLLGLFVFIYLFIWGLNPGAYNH